MPSDSPQCLVLYTSAAASECLQRSEKAKSIMPYNDLLHSLNSWTLPGLPQHTLTELLGLFHIPFILEVSTHAIPRRKEF